MNEIVVADIGGTNARFALAAFDETGRPHLGEAFRYSTSEYSSLSAAWRRFAEDVARPLPGTASLAIAGPVDGEVIKLTNSPWVMRKHALPEELGLDRLLLINDFGAVAHGIVHMDDQALQPIAGPAGPLPSSGVISVIGPGTGLGAAIVHRRGSSYDVIETEGGHIDFAPLDPLEARILDRLRQRYLRVSVERIVSGPGLADLFEALAAIEDRAVRIADDKTMWARALEGSDPLASSALDRLCMSFGSVAGDLALAHGAQAVVLAGSLANRMADRLKSGHFQERFVSKGRFRQRMMEIPVRLCAHPEPGLYGAAAAISGGSAQLP